MTENEISYKIRGAIFNVYNRLGPGLLESAYQAALESELRNKQLKFSSQVGLPMEYDERLLPVGYRIDIIVEGKVVVEIKSVTALHDVHHKQIITYLKLSGIKLGILVNFNTNDIASGIHRKIFGQLQ